MRHSTVINHSKPKRKRSLENPHVQIKSKKRRTQSSQNKRTPSHLKEITLPNWQCICPNIDQILSNKHTQSGVYAHEVHLVQQELEALLSMSIVRENLLRSKNPDQINSTIRQHKEAENVYTSKRIPNKPLPPLINHSHPRQNGPQLLLDRQVSVTPVIGARIDKIWSDVNTYYRKISSNDILTIENLVEFDQNFEEKIQQYQTEYKNHLLTQRNIKEQLNEENFEDLLNISSTNSLTSHYIDRTTIGRIQSKLYERIPHTSPVYKTPTSSPFYKKSLGNRISPRLHRVEGGDKTSSTQFHERIQLVRDYLTDQHPVPKPKSSHPKKSSKHQQNSSPDVFESKLSTLITLSHECSTLSLCALKRARLQLVNEQTWQKLNTIEHDLELLVEKLDTTGADQNSIQKLENLLKDWKKLEEDFNQQLEQFE